MKISELYHHDAPVLGSPTHLGYCAWLAGKKALAHSYIFAQHYEAYRDHYNDTTWLYIQELCDELPDDRQDIPDAILRQALSNRVDDVLATLDSIRAGYIPNPDEPIKAFSAGGVLKLSDGYHRCCALAALGVESVEVEMVPPTITVCCLKQGTKYGADYVNKLYRGVLANLRRPFDFICYTDDPTGVNCQTMPLLCEEPGWWGKMGFYQEDLPGVMTEKILFLDLDVVITGILEPVIDFDSDFAMVKDYPLVSCTSREERFGNSSAILLRVGSQTQIWEKFRRKGRGRHGDQEFVNEHFYGSMDLLPPTLAKSYRMHRLQNRRPNCALVMFHGEPKPHQCGGWVKELWR
jgi:hypothetical protein